MYLFSQKGKRAECRVLTAKLQFDEISRAFLPVTPNHADENVSLQPKM
jgi:hypothetical protein